jgi:hypothetical protein
MRGFVYGTGRDITSPPPTYNTMHTTVVALTSEHTVEVIGELMLKRRILSHGACGTCRRASDMSPGRALLHAYQRTCCSSASKGSSSVYAAIADASSLNAVALTETLPQLRLAAALERAGMCGWRCW